MTLKQFIYRTPLAKLAKDVEASLQYATYPGQPLEIKEHKTVYCISPYKTGTTFLASTFDVPSVRHEPDQYLALKKLDKDFDTFFIKRMNKLNLKLECSGFWSAYIDELAAHPIASELNYLCILREPSSWITSVVNFWNRPYTHAMAYEYENELFWKPKMGLDIREIFDSNGEVKPELLQKIIDFYFEFTRNTRKLKNMHYVKLKELKDSVYAIGELIGEEPDLSKSWMRKAKADEKKYVYRNEALDQEYNELISSFTLLNSKR